MLLLVEYGPNYVRRNRFLAVRVVGWVYRERVYA